MTTVRLNCAEVFYGAMAGVMRRVSDMKVGRAPGHGLDPSDEWGVDIRGALGEMAVAKWLGVYWSGRFEFRGVDVGHVEVRTAAKPTHSLILHDRDPDARPFILVTGTCREFELRGWVYGSEGKRREFWSDPKGGRPAYFVPQSALNPMDTLPQPSRVGA